MVEHRKYLPQELDYVLARVAAGWKFETIARAFKQDFASHWADRLFTKKQVQYIKNTYRRPPGTIQPYDGPIPNFSPSPTPQPQNHIIGLQATTENALSMDHYVNNELKHIHQTNDPMVGPSCAPAQLMITDNAYQGQRDVEDEDLGISLFASPYKVNDSKQSSFFPSAGRSTGHDFDRVDGMIDPMLDSHTGASPNDMADTYQPSTLAAVGSQFPQWTQATPDLSTHARFSGYASRLDTSSDREAPSLESGLLNSAAPDQISSGEHTNWLLRGPVIGPDYLANRDKPDHFDPSQIETWQTGSSNAQRGPNQVGLLQNPIGCSLQSAKRIDTGGWWYHGHHDGWCRIPNEHRHDYDGGVHFRHYDSYTQNIYSEQNDHVTGYLLGLCTQLQTQHPEGEAICLHQDCEEARRVAQELVDASLPEGHALRLNPLRQPHPALIRLLSSLNDRLPEGCMYDPFSQRVVRYDVPNMGGPLPTRGEFAEVVGPDVQQGRPQQDQEDLDQKQWGRN